MRSPRLRGVVFGHGHMGALHAARLRDRGDVDVTVVDPALGLAPSARVDDCDFAVVATPTRTHAGIALPLLEAGIPCLIEKPIAASLESARLLAAHPGACAGHIERFNPALAAVGGARPRFLEAQRLARWRAPSPGARGTDVDVIADLMIHDLDLALHLLPGEPTEVRAIGVGVVSGSADIVNARIEFSPGNGPPAVAVLSASRVSREPVRRLRLVEPGVYWSLDLRAGTAVRVRWGEGELEGEPMPVDVESGDPISREHTAFLAAVRGEARYPIPAAEALRSLELADRVRAAVDANR